MKLVAAFLLAALLTVAAYAVFWLVCLTYTTGQMKEAVGRGLNAQLHYGQPVWVPDFRQVAMSLPKLTLTFTSGPIREMRASSAVLQTGFLVRDHWTLQLPPQVEVQLANGKSLLVGTEDGELVWLENSRTLSLRARSVRLMNLQGRDLAKVSDVMVERRPTDAGVRINLASRPQWSGGEALLSGQVVLPEATLGDVVNLFGSDDLPGMRRILTTVEKGLRSRGGMLTLQDVSFKHGNVDGGVYGSLSVLPDGKLMGALSVSAATAARLESWLQRAGVVNPRSVQEQLGWRRLQSEFEDNPSTTLRLDVLQNNLTANGLPIGPVPNADSVVAKLWP